MKEPDREDICTLFMKIKKTMNEHLVEKEKRDTMHFYNHCN